jgi:hypothetical protein
MLIANDNDNPGWRCVVMYLESQDLVGFAATQKAIALTQAEALRLAYGLRSAAYDIVSSAAPSWDYLMPKEKFDNLIEYVQWSIKQGCWNCTTMEQFLAGFEFIYDEPLLKDREAA